MGYFSCFCGGPIDLSEPQYEDSPLARMNKYIQDHNPMPPVADLVVAEPKRMEAGWTSWQATYDNPDATELSNSNPAKRYVHTGAERRVQVQVHEPSSAEVENWADCASSNSPAPPVTTSPIDSRASPRIADTRHIPAPGAGSASSDDDEFALHGQSRRVRAPRSQSLPPQPLASHGPNGHLAEGSLGGQSRHRDGDENGSVPLLSSGSSTQKALCEPRTSPDACHFEATAARSGRRDSNPAPAIAGGYRAGDQLGRRKGVRRGYHRPGPARRGDI